MITKCILVPGNIYNGKHFAAACKAGKCFGGTIIFEKIAAMRELCKLSEANSLRRSRGEIAEFFQKIFDSGASKTCVAALLNIGTADVSVVRL